MTDHDQAVPDHEHLGPLPAVWAQRVRNAFRPCCGRPRNSTDSPCRIKVLTPGDACPWHEGIPAPWGAR